MKNKLQRYITKKNLIVLCFFLLSCLTAVANRTNDYYEWNFPENSIYSEENSGKANFSIDKGNYLVTVTYTTDSDTAQCEVKNYLAADSQNQKGITLTQVALPKANGEISFPLRVEELNRRVSVGLQTGSQGEEVQFHNIHVKSEKPYYSDSIFLLVLFWGIAVVLYFYYKKNGKCNPLIVTTILGITVLSTLPFFTDFMIWGDDLAYHMARTEGIFRSFQAGEFPVRINMLQGNDYGYASPVMYPELFLYIPALLRFTGISLMLSFKVFLALLNFMTAFLSYQCFKRIAGSSYAALAGSILYTLCSYRLVNLYVREATGELLALVFMPLILYGMYEIFLGNEKKWIWAAIGYTCVFQSHILSTFIAIVFSVLFLLAFVNRLFRNRHRFYALLKAACTTLLLNMWFLIPFLSYSSLDFPALEGTHYQLHEQSIYLPQMLAMFLKPYELSGSAGLGSIKGEMPLSMGMALAVGIGLFLVSWMQRRSKETAAAEKRKRNIGWTALLFGALALFMTSWLFPWDMIQKTALGDVFSNLQFPWRLLGIASLAFSIVSMIGIDLLFLHKWKEKGIFTLPEHVMFSVLLLAFLSSLYLIEGTTQMESSSNKAEFTAINFTDGFYYFANTDIAKWDERGNVITASPGTIIVVSEYTKKGTHITASIQAQNRTQDSYVELPLAYYPGYTATSNLQEIPVLKGHNNVVRIPLTEDTQDIQVQFQEKPSWIVGDSISILTLLSLLAIAYKRKRERNVAQEMLI